MNSGDYPYIWQHQDWPNWTYDLKLLTNPLTQVSLAQGLLLGRLTDIGMTLRDQASLAALTQDVLKTSEIEGERLDPSFVRSSIARHLGVDIGALVPVDRHVEGVVDMVLDATIHCDAIITEERLFNWHNALFPTGKSGLSSISVGTYRNDSTGAMQVVSGPLGRQRVHFEAVPCARIQTDMALFTDWLNHNREDPPLLKAGLAHLWFVTIHPFDDGNGRIARAIGDLLLARADGSPQRFYSLSAQIQRVRSDYYNILEQTQKGSLDVTSWLVWFLNNLAAAINMAHQTLDTVLVKTRFWNHWASLGMNTRQIKLLNRLLDGFEGKLNSSKWAAIAKCSSDTALRDISEMLSQGVLRKSDAGGRSTSYEIATFE